jgi:serine/threonine protein kinase
MGFDYKPHVVDPCIWATVQPTNIRESISRALNRLQAEQFEVHKVCGQGAYGLVVKCYDRVGGQMVAVKIFNSKRQARESCRMEWTALKSASAEDLDSVAKLVRCPPLARYGLISMAPDDDHGSEVHGICMQYFDTDISVEAFYQKEFATPDHIVGPAPPLVHAYMRELFKGIQCLGRAGLVHLDIKPGNFLFHVEDQKGCLVDLGLAVKKGRAGFSNIYQVGTPGFRAPELARQPSHKWTLSEPDIWSAGVVLLQLLRGSTDPNTGLEATLYDESLRQNYTKDTLSSWRSKWPRPDGSEIETPDQDPVWRLLNLTLEVDPAKRLTAQEALTLLDRTATEWDVAHTSQHQTVSQT